MKNIYIVLSYTGSLPSKLIKYSTSKTYTHVSISLDKELTQMYSFGRKKVRLPIPAGFVKENINKGLYLKQNVIILIKEIKITESQFEKLLDNISNFESNYNYYDYRGALGIYLHLNLFKDNGYVCSSFVNETLRYIGIETNKNNWEIQPEDFQSLSNSKLVYDGLASNYKVGVI